MPAPRPKRPSQPQRSATPVVPLGALIQEHDRWRGSQPGKITRGALRDHWQKQDAQHGKRPDYALWREMHGAESPPQKRQDPVDLAIRALRENDPVIHWAALTLLPDLMEGPSLLVAAKKDTLFQSVRQRLGTGRQALALPSNNPHAGALVLWLARTWLNPDETSLWLVLQSLLQAARPEWKPGRKLDLDFWQGGLPWPLTLGQISRRLAMAIHRLVIHQTRTSTAGAAALAPWHQAAWMLLRDARPSQNQVRTAELEVLLAAATTARLAGDADQASRLTALALHLLPAQLPEAFQQRARVAAWTLSEAGLAAPPQLKVSLDELPFPGDPPASENGQAAARQYLDESDIFTAHLNAEVQNDPAWDVLRKAGIVLHHPLAALSWIARKAQSYALKKQHELLQAAATLASRHHRLTTLARLLPHLPPSADLVLRYAQTLRQSQRRMPFLRDQEIWQDWTRGLRLAWARLDPDALQDPEQLFFLHESLLDREVTLLRALPQELRIPALRHLHSRSQPSPLVQALVAEPRQMQQLEHQRQTELWSVAAEWRERPALATTVWASLAMRGEPTQGRYSLIVQGPAGRTVHQDRLKPNADASTGMDITPLVDLLLRAVTETSPDATAVFLALDSALDGLPLPEGLRHARPGLSIHLIPSWEWAFRVMRETPALPPHPGDYLRAEPPQAQPPTPPSSPLPPGTCVLLPTADSCDAGTRWTGPAKPDEESSAPGSPPALLRSLQIGAYHQIISAMPVKQGPLKQDLVRLSLGQCTRTFITPTAALTNDARVHFLESPFAPPPIWNHFGLPLMPPPTVSK